MLERIRIIGLESAELLTQVLSHDFEVELSIRWLFAALDDLEASNDPTNQQIEEVFTALASLQSKLTACLARIPREHHSLIENLTDRIDIFLFHHRLS